VGACSFERAHRAGPALPSYLVLHHAGFSVLPVLPPGRWALTPPFHPCQVVCRCRAFAQLLRRRLAGFPVRRHRAPRCRRSILCGTFRDAVVAAGLSRRLQLRPLTLSGALPFTLKLPKGSRRVTLRAELSGRGATRLVTPGDAAGNGCVTESATENKPPASAAR